MKKKIIASSALALLALVSVAGASLPALAANNDDASATSSVMAKLKNRMEIYKKGQNLSATQKADLQSKMAAKKATMAQERADIQAALNSGNYDTWVAAVKKYRGENAPILKQITSANFAKFVEAHNYIAKGQSIMEDLGIKGGMMNWEK